MLKKLFRAILTLCGLLLGYGVASFILMPRILTRDFNLSKKRNLIRTLKMGYNLYI